MNSKMNPKICALMLSSALATVPAAAGVLKGLYVGQTPEGTACELRSEGMRFVDNTRHPLNERVNVEVQGQKFTLQHPAVISAADSIATFSRDTLEGILATPVGGTALVLAMDHSPGNDGPTGYTVITHAWKKDERKKVECLNLKFVE